MRSATANVSALLPPPEPEDASDCKPASALDRRTRVISSLDRISFWKAGLMVFLAGMVTMLLLTFVARPLFHRHLSLGNDAYDGYLQLARNLASGNGYVFEPGGHKVFHRPPLYPLLLVPGALLPERACRFYVAALNAFLLALAALVLRVLAAEIFSKRVASVASFIFGFSPFLLWSVMNPMAPICQTLAYLLILLFSWRVYTALHQGRRLGKALALKWLLSLLAGIMCHGTMLAISLLLIATLIGLSVLRAQWRSLRLLILAALLLIACIAPWTWRNYKVTGLFIPVAGNSGLAYFAGNALWGINQPPLPLAGDLRNAALRGAGFPSEDFSRYLDFYGFKSAADEKLANSRAKKDLRDHPAAFAKKVLLNAVEYYFQIFFYLRSPAGALPGSLPFPQRLLNGAILDAFAVSAYHLVLLAFALLGARYLWGRKEMRFQLGLLSAAAAFYAIPYFPFLTRVAHGLYTFGTIPSLAVATAVWLVRPERLAVHHSSASFE
jgi:hypothetical protein